MDCLPRKVSVVACITGALRAKRGERGLWCEARDDRELRAEKGRKKKYKAPVRRPIKEHFCKFLMYTCWYSDSAKICNKVDVALNSSPGI